MKPVLFVTVGTSLYESATWDPERAPASGLRSYEVWTRADGPDATLLSPEARRLRSEALSLRSQLVAQLQETNGEEWANALPEALFGPAPHAQGMRYGAELATLLLFARKHRNNLETFPQFLARHEIRVAFDLTEQPGDRPRAVVAARHLMATLSRVAPASEVNELPIEDLSSPIPDDLLAEGRGLGKLLSEIQKAAAATADPVSVILSGGFKIYGVMLGRLLADEELNLRLVYIHEAGSGLVEIDHRTVTVGETTSSLSERGGIEG